MASPSPKIHASGIAHLCILHRKPHMSAQAYTSSQGEDVPVFSDDSLTVFCHVCLLLAIPEVQEEQEEHQNKGVRGQRAYVQEREHLA